MPSCAARNARRALAASLIRNDVLLATISLPRLPKTLYRSVALMSYKSLMAVGTAGSIRLLSG